MTTPRARLLAILKEPDRFGISDWMRHADGTPYSERAVEVCADKNARHRLKRLCDEYAIICSDRAKEWAKDEFSENADWALRARTSAAEADRCAAAILALGEPNEHS